MKNNSQGIRINLLSYKQESKKEKRQQFLWIAAVTLSSFLLIGGTFFVSHQKKLDILELRQLNQGIETELAKMNQSTAQWESPASVQAELSRKRQAVEQLESSQIDYSELLEEIDHLLLPGITVAKIEAGRGYVSLQAYASSNEEMVKFISTLKSDPFFVEIDKFSSNLIEESGEVAFDLSLFWEEAVQ